MNKKSLKVCRKKLPLFALVLKHMEVMGFCFEAENPNRISDSLMQ